MSYYCFKTIIFNCVHPKWYEQCNSVKSWLTMRGTHRNKSIRRTSDRIKHPVVIFTTLPLERVLGMNHTRFRRTRQQQACLQHHSVHPRTPLWSGCQSYLVQHLSPTILVAHCSLGLPNEPGTANMTKRQSHQTLQKPCSITQVTTSLLTKYWVQAFL